MTDGGYVYTCTNCGSDLTRVGAVGDVVTWKCKKCGRVYTVTRQEQRLDGVVTLSPQQRKRRVLAIITIGILVLALLSLHFGGLFAPNDVHVTGRVSLSFTNISFSGCTSYPCGDSAASAPVTNGEYSVTLRNFVNYTFSLSGHDAAGNEVGCSGTVYVSSLTPGYDFSPFCIVL
jgi:hypothetical protein